MSVIFEVMWIVLGSYEMVKFGDLYKAAACYGVAALFCIATVIQYRRKL